MPAQLPECYTGGGETEWGERDVADVFTRGVCHAVLEFGGGAGSVSTIVQQHLENPANHVVVEPYEEKERLVANKQQCNLQFQVIDHLVAEGEGARIRDMVDQDFDCLVVDCENCLVEEYRKNPDLFRSVKRIQVERDDGGDYDALFEELGFHAIHTGKGCDGGCVTEVLDRK